MQIPLPVDIDVSPRKGKEWWGREQGRRGKLVAKRKKAVVSIGGYFYSSSLAKLFTVEINDSLQIRVGLRLPNSFS